jgi:hypothetical protein
VATLAVLAIACEPDARDGVSVRDELLAVERWAFVGAFPLDDEEACRDCLAVATAELTSESPQRVVETLRVFVHDPGASGKTRGDLLCVDVAHHNEVDLGDANADPDLRWAREWVLVDRGCPTQAEFLLLASEIVERDQDGRPAVASWWHAREPREPFDGWRGEPYLMQLPSALALRPDTSGADPMSYPEPDCVVGREGDDRCVLPTYSGPR